jgi:cobalt-zinc-cadmium efflux system protein
MSESHDNHENCDHQADNLIKPDRIFKIGISLNLAFVFIEIYYGYLIDSLSLISDAFHNLTDVFALMIGWLGYELTKRSKAQKYSLWTALFNSSVLLLGSLWVIREAVLRLQHPAAPAAITMIVVSSVGCVVNFFSARLFHKDHHHDLNMKSAHLHLMADAAISLGVAIAGIMIYFFSLDWIDPAFSIVISAVIVYGSGQIITESVQRLKN